MKKLSKKFYYKTFHRESYDMISQRIHLLHEGGPENFYYDGEWQPNEIESKIIDLLY